MDQAYTPAPMKQGAPFVLVTLDRPRKMRFGSACIYQVEQTLGVKLEKITEMEMGMTEMLQISCAALERDCRDANEAPITPLQLADLLDDNGTSIVDLWQKIMEGLQAAMGQADPNGLGLTAANLGTGSELSV